MKQEKQDLQDVINNWWKENREKFFIERESGTLLHKVAFIIHLLAKIVALIPTFSKKISPKSTSLSPELKQALQDKVDLYLKETKKHEDSEGFILHEHCDSTLMSGLYGVSGGKVNLGAARDSKGWWHRRPVDRPCYPNHSASTISRDMMLGAYWYCWKNKFLGLANNTYIHSKEHSYVLGKGDLTRLIMMPGGEATLAEIIFRLGGKNRRLARKQPQSWPTNLSGYNVHLLMLHAILRGQLLGYVTKKMYKAFKSYADKNPLNPLHQYAYRLYTDGDMDQVVELLMDERFWPNDRLPRRKDRKNDWITSRDYDANWQPATSGDLEKEHPGGDFLFVAQLVLSSLD